MNMKKLTGYDLDDLFAWVGLQRQRSTLEVLLQTMGLLTIGAVIGAGAGVMLAPSSGRRLREDMNERIGQLRGKMKTTSENGKRELMNAIQGG